jgi:3-methyladenine DNA glycosylase/8-oxoguanine DNA glycosylase
VTVRSLRDTLAVHRAGAGDPSTRLTEGCFLQATHTPDGPGALLLRWSRDPAPVDDCGLTARAWGPGSAWLLGGVDQLVGLHDEPTEATRHLDQSPPVAKALEATRATRIGASRNLYHRLLPTIVEQRITSGEARRQWRRLCRAFREPAPGPAEVVGDLLLPPSPAALRAMPLWWFHQFGIEGKRARALVEVARHAEKLWSWSLARPSEAAGRLSLLRGIGPWTVGSVLGPCLGDPDAVPVGDFHLPHIVAWNLAGEARADDRRMLELLEPYRGQRGRVLQALVRAGGREPAFGPRRRVLAIQHL